MTKKSTFIKLLMLLLATTLFAASCSSAEESVDTSAETQEVSQDAEKTAEEGDKTEEVELTQGGSTLAEVKARGKLNCGVAGSTTAFSVTQPDGSQQGLDADYCRALAAAVLGDPDAVNFVQTSGAERFTVIQTGKVDVLMRNTTHTQSRDTDIGVDFGPTTYYDGQQLMGRARDGFSVDSTIADIDGAIVCTNAGTTTEKNISDVAEAAGVNITLNTFEDMNIVMQNFMQDACDLTTTDGSSLVGRIAEQQPEGEEWVLFPSTPISKEPLSPVFAQNDSQWADIVSWTVYATLIADENGITSENVEAAKADPPTAEIGRLLGGEGELQTAMGLEADAFYNVIKSVGNYDEIFERHLVPVGLKREGSANALWTEGGLHYPPPAR